MVEFYIKIKGLHFLFQIFYIFISELIYCIINNGIFSFFCCKTKSEKSLKSMERLIHRLASTNILCVKIFQALALDNNIMDKEINNQLLQFTDHAIWSNTDIDVNTLQEVCDKYNICINGGFNTPINAGMISLIYKGTQNIENDTSYAIIEEIHNKCNRNVIIKIKRTQIDEKLNKAIEQIQFVLYLLSFVPFICKYRFADIIDKNIQTLKKQTDFLQEINNMVEMKNNCKNLKYIKIPVANREITEKYPNVIVMEYIEGLNVTQIREEDYEGFAKQIIKFGLVTTIIHGLTHGDLHSGNILFIKDESDVKYPYKLGIIDFGIVFNIESKYRNILFSLLVELFEIPARDSAIKILNSGIIEPINILENIPKEHSENIISFIEEIIYETISVKEKVNQIQIYKFLIRLNEYLKNKELQHIGIRPSDNFVKTQLVLAMAHGITLKLCNDDFLALMDKTLDELFHTKMMTQ